MKSTEKLIKERIKALEEENKRLNNIINELEKDLKNKIEEDRLNILANSHWLYILNKIKELKENKYENNNDRIIR